MKIELKIQHRSLIIFLLDPMRNWRAGIASSHPPVKIRPLTMDSLDDEMRVPTDRPPVLAESSPAKVRNKQSRSGGSGRFGDPKKRQRRNSLSSGDGHKAIHHDHHRVIERTPTLNPSSDATVQYEGEQADRRTTIKWFYMKVLGSPPEAEWQRFSVGVVQQIQLWMGLPDSSRPAITRVLKVVLAGGDVRGRLARRGKLLMGAVEHKIIADLTRSGFGLAQATAHVNAFRKRHNIGRNVTKLADDGTQIVTFVHAVGRETVRQATIRMGRFLHRRQTKKCDGAKTSKDFVTGSLRQAQQHLAQLDPQQVQKCMDEGWPVWELEMIIWYDERHRKCTLGNASTYEYLYELQPDGSLVVQDDGTIAPGGSLPPQMPRTAPN